MLFSTLWITFTTCQAETLVKKLYLPRNSEEAIAQDAARQDLIDIADSYGGETSASGDNGGVNKVTRDNRKSRDLF